MLLLQNKISEVFSLSTLLQASPVQVWEETPARLLQSPEAQAEWWHLRERTGKNSTWQAVCRMGWVSVKASRKCKLIQASRGDCKTVKLNFLVSRPASQGDQLQLLLCTLSVSPSHSQWGYKSWPVPGNLMEHIFCLVGKLREGPSKHSSDRWCLQGKRKLEGKMVLRITNQCQKTKNFSGLQDAQN